MAIDFSKYGIDAGQQPQGIDFSKYGIETSEQQVQENTSGYFQRVSSRFQDSAEKITSSVKQGAEAYQTGVKKNTFGGAVQATGGLFRSGLRTVGEVAGSAFTPILEAPIIKPLTEKIIGKALENPEVQSVVSKAQELATKYPNASKDAQNIFDIVTLGYGKSVEAPLAKELKAIGGDLSQGVKVVLTPSEEVVQNKIVSLFNKSIKPTAKKTLAQGDKYENNIITAMRTIKSNADNLNIIDDTGELVSGRVPQTIQELAQGLDQTKDLVFKQYDDLAKQAGTQGAIIDAKPIADEVLKVAQNKALQLTNPEVIKYAEDWSNRLRGFDILDTETTQEVIKLMNNNLQSFYKNPTYDTATKVAVDAGIANNFRKALDSAIEGATGENYQTLKNQYSALKAIENDVVRASMREARKNTKGLLDYSDIFTGGQMIGGIMSLNPAMFTKGAVERGIKEYIKFLNDPNRAISNIFEKLNIESPQSFAPNSSVGKFIKNPKLGMSVQAVDDLGNPITNKVDDLTSSISKAKASGQSFDEWVKGQKQAEYSPLTTQQVDRSVKLLNESGVPVKNGDDILTLYHGTNAKGVKGITESGTLNEFSYMATDKNASKGFVFGKGGDVLEIKVPVKDAGFVQQSMAGSKGATIQNPVKLVKGKDGIWRAEQWQTRSQLKAEWDKVK